MNDYGKNASNEYQGFIYQRTLHFHKHTSHATAFILAAQVLNYFNNNGTNELEKNLCKKQVS